MPRWSVLVNGLRALRTIGAGTHFDRPVAESTGSLVDCAPMGISNAPDRRRVAIAVTSDGRRVQVPVENHEVPVLSLIRSILVGIEELVLLITGARREHGGKRRDGRS